MTLRDFSLLAEELWLKVPGPLKDDLPGGLVVAAGAKRRGGGLILGEYQRDGAGSRIVLYHGSFRLALLGRAPATWRERIAATLRHELRHHIEYRAGRMDLARAEEAERAGR